MLIRYPFMMGTDSTSNLPTSDGETPDRELVDSQIKNTDSQQTVSDNRIKPEQATRIVGNRYEILGQSISGGMGSVFAAWDTRLERKVAIKIISSGSGQDFPDRSEKSNERLLSEARAMAGLKHPHICVVHEVVIDAPAPYIVMEWVEGLDLTRAWSRANLKWRMSIFVKIVDAIAAAHRENLVHRDLKPANILVNNRSEPVIVDFGLAKTILEDSSGKTFGGTPGYAAPEQFSDGASIGPASDVFALGVVLFEMLTNSMPFTGCNPAEVIRNVETMEPHLPEEFAPNIPWPLQRICLTAIERDVELRYPNAQAMLDDIERYLRGESVAARPSLLTNRFSEQVEEQLAHIEAWRNQGLVTSTESDKLERVLTSILKPESHWIVDSRALSWSQVTLYLGGWFVLIALAIGLGMAWHVLTDLSSEYRVLPAVIVTTSLFVLGFILQRKGHQQVFLGFLITACLATPVTMWLIFLEYEWLEGIGTGSGGMEILELLNYGVPGLSNAQLLIESFIWLVLALILRISTKSSAFTPFAILAGLLVWLSAWSSAGMLQEESIRWYLAGLGLWIVVLGLLLLPLGLRLNRKEGFVAREFGRISVRSRDSWSLLTLSVLAIGLGLALTAMQAPEIQTLGLFSEYLSNPDSKWDDSLRTTPRAVAFIVNGFVLFGLIVLLDRRRTVIRRRLAELVRWVMPSHWLAAALILAIDFDSDTSETLKLLWIIILAAGAVIVCFWSVHRQWRPFLFAGLFYIAAAYFRVFMWMDEKFDNNDPAHDFWFVVMALAVLGLGILTMMIAWKSPNWVASSKLSQWASKHHIQTDETVYKK